MEESLFMMSPHSLTVQQADVVVGLQVGTTDGLVVVIPALGALRGKCTVSLGDEVSISADEQPYGTRWNERTTQSYTILT